MAEPHARQLGEMREQIHRHPTVNERLLDRLKSPYEKLHLARQELANTRQMLQVLNRQLSIANTELGSKISELGSGPIDEATGPRPTAILLLDRSLILRSFSSTAHSPLTLSPADNGTSVEDHLRRLPDADALLQEIHEVATSGVSRDREVHDNKNGVRYRVQILPHRDAKGLLDGSLVVFLDM
ncbi:MAG: PAS domain-containing protein [Alphaproteobacteria bacterium]|nr:PAS domain-containing protein [Alphaproteobacteria bacterium]